MLWMSFWKKNFKKYAKRTAHRTEGNYLMDRKKNVAKHISKLRRTLACMSMALVCTGCHYDSNVDIDEFRESSLAADLDIIYEGIPEFSAPLTLEDIYDIASARNLNILVKELEYQIQTELVTRERFSMLPDIRAHFDSLIRNRNTASFSQSLIPGVPPAPLSISSQKHQWRWDYAVVWNYVDFGLAFLRSRQEYNRAVKLQFEYKRLQQNLFVDITRQYWKALTAKLAREKSKTILEKARIQQAAVQKQLAAKIISEIQGLRSEGQLITFQAQFQFYDKEYHTALSELGLLMGLPPCVEFELADVISFGLDACLEDICELETLALYNRPELYSDDAEELIQRDEARVAVLQMYPGVDLFAGHNHDSNKFLLFGHWIQAGTRAAYNLLDWPRHLQESRAASGRVLLAKNNRVLMSVSVMAQVHLAHSIYQDNQETYALAKTLEDVNRRLLKAAQSEQREGKLHEADVLKYEIELLESEIDTLKQYGELQNSLEQLNNAMGLPLYYVNSREYGILEEGVAPQQEIKKISLEEEDEEADAEELRDIYLDYIIENIEKAEERTHQEPLQSAEDQQEDNEEPETSSPSDDNSLEDDQGSSEEDSQELDDQENTEEDDQNKIDDQPSDHLPREESLPSQTDQSPRAQENENSASFQAAAMVEDIINRYQAVDQNAAVEDDEAIDLDVLIQKYGIAENAVNRVNEENNENNQAYDQTKDFFTDSYDQLIDTFRRFFTRIQSFLRT
jgi:outer membrane protein TolC